MSMSGIPDASTRVLLISDCCPQQMRKRVAWSVDQFHVLKKLGSGYASSVYLGTCRQTGLQVAIKMYHKAKLSELNYFQISREIRIHSQLDHQNILQLWAAFEDAQGVYLISEYAAKGDVFSNVEQRGGFITEPEAVRQIIYPFLCALQYLHGNNIIHRDIKPENLLLNAMGVLKVADFGLSINVAEERPVTRVGTLDYMSPEVVTCPDKAKPQDNKEMKHLYYTALVDAWAVGVLAYELIVGKPPFDRGNKKATVQEILQGEPIIPPTVSEEARNFIQWSLTKDPRRRPSVADLMEHTWVTENMSQPVSRKGIQRADSFVQPRVLMRPDNAMDTRDSSSMELTVQSNRMMQSSVSMSAIDMMRFRDVRLELIRADAAKSRAGSGSGAHADSNPRPLETKKSLGHEPTSGTKREAPAHSSGGSSTLTPRKTVVIAAADPNHGVVPSGGSLTSKKSTGLRKQVSFGAAKALADGSAGAPQAPAAPHTAPGVDGERSPLVRHRSVTASAAGADNGPTSPTATRPSSSVSQNGSRLHAQSSGVLQSTPSGHHAQPMQVDVARSKSAISVEQLRELTQMQAMHHSGTRPNSSGTPLIPSRHGSFVAAAPGQLTGHSTSNNGHHQAPLYSSTRTQEYAQGLLGEVQRSQRSFNGVDAFRNAMQPSSLSGLPKNPAFEAALQQRLISTWNASDMDQHMHDAQ